jgi:DNA-binding beta-propeller fold protein YncE
MQLRVHRRAGKKAVLAEWRRMAAPCLAGLLPLFAIYRCYGGDARLVWPAPPAAPCIAFERAISQPSDIGARPAAVSRIANWLAGGEQEKERLSRPFGLALDEEGNLLVTDTAAKAVFCLEPSSKTWMRFDSVEKLRFECPVGIAGYKGAIFVADSALGKVIGFNRKRKLLFELIEGVGRPSGLAVSAGKLFITDSQLHHVLVCDLQGRTLGSFGKRGGGPGEFNFPSHISADANGHLYVTDSLNYRVQVFDTGGRFIRAIGSPGDTPGHFGRPKGVTADNFGHLYVVDALFDNVQIFDGAGQLLLNWGEGGSEAGEFWLPNGIAISRDNQIYVADTYNHRIQVFQFIGKQ